jgi:hypothetical protein
MQAPLIIAKSHLPPSGLGRGVDDAPGAAATRLHVSIRVSNPELGDRSNPRHLVVVVMSACRSILRRKGSKPAGALSQEAAVARLLVATRPADTDCDAGLAPASSI